MELKEPLYIDGELASPKISDRANEVVQKVKALRSYTERTGFRTTRSQNDLIQSLSDPDDLAGALLLLNE